MPSFNVPKEHVQRLQDLVHAPDHWKALVDPDNPWFESASHMVARLLHLQGVPFRYLVPDSRMLPAESIRFFRVDPNWLRALVDGALSLGRITESDALHDDAICPVLMRQGRRRAQQLRHETIGVSPPKAVEDELPVTGFLLRSAVVAGWPGLEVEAHQSTSVDGKNTCCDGAKVNMIRMDRLSKDVLLCLFDDVFHCVQIHEPKEGITFGATRHHDKTANSFTKDLRGLGVGGYTVGTFLEDATIPVPMRSGADRVVSVDQLRQDMATKLESLSPAAWDKTRPFTSAEFTLEMVQGASQSIFTDARAPKTLQASKQRTLHDELANSRAALHAHLSSHTSQDHD